MREGHFEQGKSMRKEDKTKSLKGTRGGLALELSVVGVGTECSV